MIENIFARHGASRGKSVRCNVNAYRWPQCTVPHRRSSAATPLILVAGTRPQHGVNDIKEIENEDTTASVSLDSGAVDPVRREVASPRGFAAMDPQLVSELAKRGGKAAHRAGTAHQFTSDEARVAGRKGGIATHALARRNAEPGVIELIFPVVQLRGKERRDQEIAHIATAVATGGCSGRACQSGGSSPSARAGARVPGLSPRRRRPQRPVRIARFDWAQAVDPFSRASSD